MQQVGVDNFHTASHSFLLEDFSCKMKKPKPKYKYIAIKSALPTKLKLNSVALVRERTIPTDRPGFDPRRYQIF